MLSLRIAVALCAAAIASTPALAALQDRLELPDLDGPQIVVTGIAEGDRAIADFVGGIGRETSTDQLARWHGTVCPLTIGLRDELNDYVSDTVIAIADMVGLDAQPGDCRANVLIVISDDPAGFLDEMREERIDIYRSISRGEQEAIRAGELAVLGFSRIELRGADGRAPDLSMQVSNDGGSSSSEMSSGIIQGVQPSKTQLATRADLNVRVVVIDLNHLNGQTMQQLSGFAAMMALGEFDVTQPIRPSRTILNLFHDAESAPADITDWDIAYLRALYATDGAYSSHVARSVMIREVRRAVSAGSND